MDGDVDAGAGVIGGEPGTAEKGGVVGGDLEDHGAFIGVAVLAHRAQSLQVLGVESRPVHEVLGGDGTIPGVHFIEKECLPVRELVAEADLGLIAGQVL